MDNTTTMDHAEFTARRSLPMMALRGLTVFPGMMLTFEVERSMSIAALNMAMSDDQIIYLVPQKDIATDIPTPDDVYGVGTVCRIKQMMKQPGTKTIRVMAEGIERGRTLAVRTDTPCFVAEVEPMPDVQERKTARTEALIRHCCNLFDAYVTASGNMAPESVISVLGQHERGVRVEFYLPARVPASGREAGAAGGDAPEPETVQALENAAARDERARPAASARGGGTGPACTDCP